MSPRERLSRYFELVWDWWYPIDEYLDLYNI